MQAQKTWGSNVERFQATLAPRLNPPFVPGSTRWDISGLTCWKQLFIVTQLVIQNFPILHLVLDGGSPDVFERVRTVLRDALPKKGFEVRYRWVPPWSKEVSFSPNITGEWPRCRGEFEIVSPMRPAFHGGRDDIVFLLPPENLYERQEYWQDYLEKSWVVVAWEEFPSEQETLLAEFKSHIEDRAARRQYMPWFFKGSEEGLQHIECWPYDVCPLPDKIRKKLKRVWST